MSVAVETDGPVAEQKRDGADRAALIKFIVVGASFALLPALVSREYGRAAAGLVLVVIIGLVVAATFALGPRLGMRRGVAWAIGFPFLGVVVGARSVWRLLSFHRRHWNGTHYPAQWTLPWKLAAWLGALFLASAVAGLPRLVGDLPAGHSLSGDVPAYIETIDDLLAEAGFVYRQRGRSLVVMEERLPPTSTRRPRVLALWVTRRGGPFGGWRATEHSSVNVVEGAAQDVRPGRRPLWIFRGLAPDASWVEATFEGRVAGGGTAASGYAVVFGPPAKSLTGWRVHALDGDLLVDYGAPPTPAPSASPDVPQ